MKTTFSIMCPLESRDELVAFFTKNSVQVEPDTALRAGGSAAKKAWLQLVDTTAVTLAKCFHSLQGFKMRSSVGGKVVIVSRRDSVDEINVFLEAHKDVQIEFEQDD